jgi:exonuclease III
MIALFYNYADPDGYPSRDFMGVFDDMENIPIEYRREEWNDSDNRRNYYDNERIIEPQIKSYGGKRFYLPSEAMESKKMLEKLDWYEAFGFYSAHDVKINEIFD